MAIWGIFDCFRIVVEHKYCTIIINCHYFIVLILILILILILGCTDLLRSEIRPGIASGAKSDTWQFPDRCTKSTCHIKYHDTKYNSKSLIIQKIIKKLPSSVFNHRLNTIAMPSTCLNCRRFSLSLTAKKSYMALLIQLSNRRQLVVVWWILL